MIRLAIILFFLQLIVIGILAFGYTAYNGEYNIYTLIGGILFWYVSALWFTKNVKKIKEKEQEQKDIDDILKQ